MADIATRIAALHARAAALDARFDKGRRTRTDMDGDGVHNEGRRPGTGPGTTRRGAGAAMGAAGRAATAAATDPADKPAVAAARARNRSQGLVRLGRLREALKGAGDHSQRELRIEIEDARGLLQGAGDAEARTARKRLDTAAQVAREFSAARDAHVFTAPQRSTLRAALAGEIEHDRSGKLARRTAGG